MNNSHDDENDGICSTSQRRFGISPEPQPVKSSQVKRLHDVPESELPDLLRKNQPIHAPVANEEQSAIAVKSKPSLSEWLVADGNRAMHLFSGFVVATVIWGLFAVAPVSRKNDALAAENAALWHCIEAGGTRTRNALDGCLRDYNEARRAVEAMGARGIESDYEGRATVRGR